MIRSTRSGLSGPEDVVRLSVVAAALLAVTSVAAGPLIAAQLPQGPPASQVERISANVFRVGNVQVDTSKKEVSVKGRVNEVTTLEFVASTKGGYKNYESALELDTTAINFNVALLLIGLDPARATPPTRHLDPTPPKGDPVEVWVEWGEGSQTRRIRAERLVYDGRTRQTLSEGPWVYTGSAFSKETNGFLADLDGPIIGFVHSPSPLIDSPRSTAGGPYGIMKLNPDLKLAAGTSVLLTVKALPLVK